MFSGANCHQRNWPPQGTPGQPPELATYFPAGHCGNLLSNTIAVPAIVDPWVRAYDAFCATTRFALTMASGGRQFARILASCDGGMVNIILTATESTSRISQRRRVRA